MVCDTCKKSLPEDGEHATCGKCKLHLHFNCAGIQKSVWKVKSIKKKAEWECMKCRATGVKTRTSSIDFDDDSDNDDPTYLALKKLLTKMFKRQEDTIAQRVDNIINMVGKIEETITGLMNKVQEIEENAYETRKELEDLRMELESEKQYGRSRNFIVTSIPQSEKEDVPEKIVELVKTMDINMKKEEITAHRLPSPRSPAPIIVQCTTRAIRDNIVHKARKFRPNTSLITNNQPERAIYFNDHLTPYFSDLMKKTKELKDRLGFRFVWLNGNRIMLKKDHQSRAFKIQTVSDLDKIG